MKKLINKPWFIGLLTIGLLLLVLLSNLGILSLELASPYEENFWVLAREMAAGNWVNVFAFAYTILFYASIATILFCGISILRKNNKGFVFAIITFTIFETVLIIFHAIFQLLSTFALILAIINVVLILFALVLTIIRSKYVKHAEDRKKTEKELKLVLSRIPLLVLVADIVAILIQLLTFIVPAYAVTLDDVVNRAVLANVLFAGETDIVMVVFFLIEFAFFLGVILFFAKCVSYYFYDKAGFVQKSKTLLTYVFIVTLVFFLEGLAMVIYLTINGSTAETIAYVPMLLATLDFFVFSIFLGKFHALNHSVLETSKLRFPRIESLLYVVLMTAITGGMLFLNIIIVSIQSGSYEDSLALTGITLLRDYASLDPGYRIIAYVLVVMLISSFLYLIAAIAGYLSKYRHYDGIVKSAAAVNIFFIFMISISGYYFQIGQQIDRSIIMDIFEFYGVPAPGVMDDYTYAIRSEALYALVGAIALLVIMFLRKAFDRDDLVAIAAVESSADDGSSSTSLSTNDRGEETPANFDPCPAFTELDGKVEAFREELARRKTFTTKNTTLNELVSFVVDYARNSRLHLSYTEEDIATFIAGLGASRLSILQGMSGTGKTSLPKIFSEAILGNCEIVEVESSWKDKNELLGYYNEFSMKYTPKKFTLALYKSSLNKETFTIVLLDEMNLSRIEYYFSDFLSLMEHEEDKRELKLINIKLNRINQGDEIDYLALEEGHTLRIPPNVWFIGTANRDESTFVISDKVYDRAQTMNFTKRAAKVRNYSNPILQQYYDYETMNRLLQEAREKGTFDAENNALVKSVEALMAPFNISFGNRILKQIEDFVNIYCACFENDDVTNEAVEKILLSKVVAKLEVKTIDDKEKLIMEFEKLHLEQCVDFIKRLDGE
ncbi:MAG: hypothetical protein WC088_05895 [Candidatus Izemoplasmatales bacterium]